MRALDKLRTTPQIQGGGGGTVKNVVHMVPASALNAGGRLGGL
jgi:hypothetical protein